MHGQKIGLKPPEDYPPVDFVPVDSFAAGIGK